MNLTQLMAANAPPIIAILRGVRPAQIVSVGEALIGAGIRIVEVPLNSPHALVSIELLRGMAPKEVLVGAGTVTTLADLNSAVAAGARLIVTPNTEPAIIRRCVDLGLDVVPGVMTATEAFSALAAGARHLKLFPASTCGTSHLRALLDVLPPGCHCWAVGGTHAGNLADWLQAGATGVGVGGGLYKPGSTSQATAACAEELVRAWTDSKLS